MIKPTAVRLDILSQGLMVRSAPRLGRNHHGTNPSRERRDTHAVRTALQRSQTSLTQLSRELGLNPKAIAKRRKVETVEDLKTWPKQPRATVFTEAEEAMIIAFRRHTLLPLNDCL